jgi:hypothetical protein
VTRLLDDGVETDAQDAQQLTWEYTRELIAAVRGGASLDQMCIWGDCKADLWAHLSGYQVPTIEFQDNGFISAHGLGGFKIEGAIQ